MKFLGVAALLAAVANAHYVFPSVTYNGQKTADWEYVRQTNNYQSNGPVTDVGSREMTCYQTTMNAANVKTLDVKAGTTIDFNARASISHPGSLNVYIAKAPAGTPVSQFDGSGAVWSKILYEGPNISPSGLTWPSNGLQSVPVKLPSCLEDGEYLLRIEHIALHSASSPGGAQLYISCAQLKVTGGSGGLKGNKLSFPGSYSPTDPGLMINIYYPVPTSYSAPGGQPATC
ncbi:related to cellulose binding protein CEL1 [Cephalotrichum gorgonifer]|uniref:lytic cellulose monooxygenase (C4-dehydrogenating) n=1 Tax=Cephalotrichum gorgonifer TaxID=2041049 RepID=A0AAE8N8P3_9PEZI|nr:related to cellulose binding protein CEL1 [Cephalotrichum gorgonifer]